MQSLKQTWRLLVVALILAVIAPPVQARGVALMGNVVTPSNSKTPGAPGVMPADGVTVTVQQTGETETTDAMGAFRFKSVPEGEITIVASKPGYQQSVKNYTHKGPQVGNVVLYIMPGAGMTQATEVVKPDTIYVAFSGMGASSHHGGAPNPHGPGSNHMLSGPATTNMGTLGALAYGQDPFTMGSTPPVMNASMPSVPGQENYQTIQSGSENSLMVLDPDQPANIKYVDMPVKAFWITFNVSGTKLFVATDQQNIQVFDVVNHNLVLATIPTGGAVTDMVRSGSFVYASVMGTQPGILVIDPQRVAPLRMIPTPNLSTGQKAQPRSIAVNQDGSRLYVALDAGTAGEVAVIDAFTTRALGYAKVGAQPLGVAITPDNRYILAANGKGASVSVIDAFSLQEAAQIPVGVMPTRIAVKPDGTKAYVTCKLSNDVRVINLQTLGSGASIPVGTAPMGIAVTSTGNRVFVACNGNGTVAVIDGNSDTFLKATSPQPRSRPFGVAVKP